MKRKLSLAMPVLFVLVFAFCMIVSMNTPLAAKGRPACCHVVNVCDGFVLHGECPFINGICQCNLIVSYCDGPPAACPVPPAQ